VNLNQKQRIIGIAVLVILILLLVPLLFTGSAKVIKKSELNTDIPNPPSKPVIKKIKQQNQAKAWVIQLGTFADKDNANNLIKKLQGKGFNAYSKQQKSANKYIYQVFVGPETDYNKTKAWLKNLQDSFKLKGLIIRYKI